MDSVTAVKKVRPQFSRESWKDFRLTPRRLDMLLYLWKRRAAHTGHFMLLYGGSERIYKDLNGLHHNGYAERPPGQIPLQAWMRHLKAGSLPRVYALDNRKRCGGTLVEGGLLPVMLSREDIPGQDRASLRAYLRIGDIQGEAMGPPPLRRPLHLDAMFQTHGPILDEAAFDTPAGQRSP